MGPERDSAKINDVHYDYGARGLVEIGLRGSVL
jgi:hypothetical protein